MLGINIPHSQELVFGGTNKLFPRTQENNVSYLPQMNEKYILKNSQPMFETEGFGGK